MTQFIYKWVYIFCIFLSLSALGCEQISAVVEHFKKSGKTKEVASVEAQKPAVVKQEEPLPENVLARVGRWSITKDEFNERLEAIKEVVPDYDITNLDARALVLEELVRQQLLVIDAERSGLADRKDIQDAVEEFRRTLIVREVARKITEDIEVTQEEALEFYDNNKDRIIEPVQWRVREIVVDDRLKATEMAADILKGADFAQLARQHSISQSAAEGGNLGFIVNVSFPQMEDVLLSLEQGDISSVFRGPDGYYVIKLEEKKGGQQIAFSEVGNDIIAQLTLDKQQQAILNYLNELREGIDIEVNPDLLR